MGSPDGISRRGFYLQNPNSVIGSVLRQQIAMKDLAASQTEPGNGYSNASAPVNEPETYVDYDSGTEFSRAIDGKDAYAAWEVMDELLSVLQATNPRLFDGVMRKIEQI